MRQKQSIFSSAETCRHFAIRLSVYLSLISNESKAIFKAVVPAPRVHILGDDIETDFIALEDGECLRTVQGFGSRLLAVLKRRLCHLRTRGYGGDGESACCGGMGSKIPEARVTIAERLNR